MTEPAVQDLNNCYSKQIMYSKTAKKENIFIYYPDENVHEIEHYIRTVELEIPHNCSYI